MKVLLDENVDEKLRFHLTPHGFEVQTARYAGLRSYRDGQLLDAAEGKFDVLVTHDKGIGHQNNFTKRRLSVLVVHTRTSGLKALLQYLDNIVAALRTIYPGEVVYVGEGITFNVAARAARPRP